MQIHISVPDQALELRDGEQLVKRYTVSTSRHGIGTEEGSNKTPSGRFRIAEKHGDGGEPGEIFISRVASGKRGEEGDPQDHVQTRILWLDGLDPENANTYSRYIYIHGTNAESLLGTPASHGCVRMSNLDVIELYDRVPIGTEVFIQP
jgi:L,D-transpeptidase YbiS